MKKTKCPSTVAAIEASSIKRERLLELAYPLSYQAFRSRMRAAKFERHILLKILSGIEAHCLITAQRVGTIRHTLENFQSEVY